MDITIAASAAAWTEALADVPPPGFSSFAAWQLRNPAFTVTRDALRIAQARALLEVLVEGLREGIDAASGSGEATDLSGLTGRYRCVRSASGSQANVYFESAGEGTPLLCLHAAGADGRQFYAVMSDAAITSQWRVHAFDVPSHGRTLPAYDWNGARYTTTQQDYLDWCTAFIEQDTANRAQAPPARSAARPSAPAKRPREARLRSV